jgi:hypothetical protein
MLTNWLPLCAMSKEDRELFMSLDCFICLQNTSQIDNEEWCEISRSIDERAKGNTVPRLKLKEGEWYKYGSTIVEYKNNGLYFSNGKIHISIDAVSDTLEFRPATKEEIDSVKPKEILINVELDWSQHGLLHPCDKWLTWIEVPNIGIDYGGWILAGYLFKESAGVTKDKPVKFNKGKDRTSIRSYATHARFVKVVK